MGKVRTVLSCRECGQQLAQWAGRCPGCGAWGTIEEGGAPPDLGARALETLAHEDADERRVSTGLPGIDRVLGGGLVPSTVALLAGEPGIGKSTLLLQMAASLSAAGLPCLFASGEESRRQVSARAHRLGIDGSSLSFVSGRELPAVVEAARAARPFLLAVDSIQALRDPAAGQVPGGPSQVRGCADALVGFAKAEGISVLVTGHVTKDGDLAGPRALEHAVDVVLAFDGDPRSGLRMLSAGKNRFGAEGEVAWFEMTASGLREIDPGDLLLPGGESRAPPPRCRWRAAEGSRSRSRRSSPGARARPGGRRAGSICGGSSWSGRCSTAPAWASGARTCSGPSPGAPGSTIRPATSRWPPRSPRRPPACLRRPPSAFVGEIGLTGVVRPAPGMAARLSAARAAGLRTVFVPEGTEIVDGLRPVPVRHVMQALTWAAARPGGPTGDLPP